MQNGIVIKSSRAGMTVLLDPNLPFEELLVAIAKKFKDSCPFLGGSSDDSYTGRAQAYT